MVHSPFVSSALSIVLSSFPSSSSSFISLFLYPAAEEKRAREERRRQQREAEARAEQHRIEVEEKEDAQRGELSSVLPRPPRYGDMYGVDEPVH